MKKPRWFRQRGFFILRIKLRGSDRDDHCDLSDVVGTFVTFTFERAFNESRYDSISACA